jgi:heme exporter protein CcmD
MHAITTWFAMGGYGAYVWSTYGLVLVMLLGGLLRARHQRLRTKRLLQRWFTRVA